MLNNGYNIYIIINREILIFSINGVEEISNLAINKEIRNGEKASFIIDAIIAFIFVIIGFFGIFVYTAEYNGENFQRVVCYLPTIGDPEVKLIGAKKFTYSGVQITISMLLLLFIIGYTILLILYLIKLNGNKLNRKNNEIVALQKTIEQLSTNNTKDDRMQSKQEDRVSEVIKNFIESNPDIVSVQMYKYRKNKEQDKIIYNVSPMEQWYGNTIGEVNIVNTTYRITKDVINEYNNMKVYKIKKDTDKLLKHIEGLAKDIIKNWTNSGKVTDTIVAKYSLLQIGLNLFSSDKIINYTGLNAEILGYIRKEKRTGILCGLITQDYHIFMHEDRGNKKNRLYISKCISIKNSDCIFVIIFNNTLSNNSTGIRFIKKAGEDFYNILENDLKIVYNHYKISV
jgi:hypothetical protein